MHTDGVVRALLSDPRRPETAYAGTDMGPYRSDDLGAKWRTTILVVLVAIALPLTPLAGTLGFIPLPASYFLFAGGVAVTYLVVVEVLKRRVMSGLAPL